MEGGVGEADCVVEGLEAPELDGDWVVMVEMVEAEVEESGRVGFEAVAELDGL